MSNLSHQKALGCGDHSPSLTKKYFPQCEYHGIDREIYNNTQEELKEIDHYYELDLMRDGLRCTPNDYFDVLNFSHVIEHLSNGLEVLDELLGKVKAGGYIYIEFPGMRSLYLPRAEGTLNFCDDATFHYMRKRRLHSRGLLDLFGSAEYIFARKSS